MLDPEVLELTTAFKDAVGIMLERGKKAETAEDFEEVGEKYCDLARAAAGLAGCFYHEAGKLRGLAAPRPEEEE